MGVYSTRDLTWDEAIEKVRPFLFEEFNPSGKLYTSMDIELIVDVFCRGLRESGSRTIEDLLFKLCGEDRLENYSVS